MNWNDVYLVTENLNLATDADVNELEEKQGSKLPEDYREFIKRFGEGNYCNYVSIYHPKTILENYAWWQSYARNHLWKSPHAASILECEQWANSLQIANTPDGDYLYIYKGEIYLRPRSGYEKKLGSSLADTLEWMLIEHPSVNQPLYNQHEYKNVNYRWFESWIDRIQVEYELRITNLPNIETFHKKIISLNLHRHITKNYTYLHFYVKEIYGEVLVRTEHRGAAVITYDSHKENEHYKHLVDVLEEIG
jgi:hypothetical protein